MFKATIKGLLSRKLRLTLSALAVVLGVMFVSGAFIVTETLGKSFNSMFESINADIDVQVTGKSNLGEVQGAAAIPENIPPSVVEKVEQVDGVERADAGVFAEGAKVIGKNGKALSTLGPPQFGWGWSGEDSLVQLRDGRGPQEADEIALDAATASAAKVKIGERVGVLTLDSKTRTFDLVGIFGYSGNRDTLGGAQTVAFTMPVAQELLLGTKDAYTEINVVAKEGVSQETLRDDIWAAVGGDYEVKTQKEVAEAQASDVKEGLAFLNYVLLGFAFVALFVGVFLIVNTFSMLVAQRTRELALFRAIGASRGQVVGSVLIEATAIGLVASVIGLVAGLGLGQAGAYLWSWGFKSNLELSVVLPLIAVVAAFAVGLGVTLLAALLPAIRASRIPPVAAMRDAATPDKPLTKLTVSGLVLLVGGSAALAWSLAGKAGDATLWLLLGGVLVAFIAVALLTPIVSRPVVSLLGRLFSWSVPGKLGRRNSARNPRRTAITAAALMVSIALITGVSTIMASATESISKALSGQIKADLFVAGQQTGPVPPTFDRAVVPKIEQVPGVAAVAAFYYDVARINGKDTFAAAVNDAAAMTSVLGLETAAGSIDQLGERELVLDDKTAKDNNLRVGSSVGIQLARGEKQTYTVAGLFKRTEGNQGYILAESAAENFRKNSPSQAFLQLEPGADRAQVETTVARLLEDSPEVSVQDASAFVKQATAIFDFVLLAVQLLLALAMVIAVLGIINTLALSVIERTRELGLLRAIGLGKGQMMRMITVESVVISVFGGLLGVVVGVGLGAAVVKALEEQGFTEIALPWPLMGAYLALAAVIGVVAAILPAIRAARLNVLNAIAYE